MEIKVTKEDKYTIVKPEFEKIDSTVSPTLKAEIVLINSKGERNIIIDLSDVKYIDSSGLSAILVANRLCQASNGSLVVASAQDMVLKLMQISQLDSILNITPTIAEAIDFIIMDDIEKNL
jgi:anti-sigma B factor antagonist